MLMVKQLNSLTPSFTVVFTYRDGSTQVENTSSLRFKGIQKHGIGRPSSLVVTSNTRELDFIVSKEMLETIDDLKYTLVSCDSSFVTLEPKWFDTLINKGK